MRRLHILWVSLIFVSAPAFAQNGARDKFLDIQEVRAGGMTAWLVEDRSLPIISFDFSFREAGAAYDPVDKQGLAQLTSNMLDEGAGPHDSQKFQKLLEDNSISLSYSSGRDVFSGSLETLTRNADLAFELLALSLNDPRFDEEPLERMRASNIARIKSSLSDPEWIAARIMNDVAFAGHPYARNAGGTISSLSAIKPDDMRAFVKKHFTRDNVVIGVAGDISARELAARMEQVFGGLPNSSAAATLPDSDVKNGGSITLYEMDIPQSIIQVMQGGIDVNDPDFPAAQIMDYILGGSGFGSRLTEEIREKRGLTYGIHTSFYDLEHLDGYIVSTSTKNEKAAELLDLTKKQWARMRDEKVSEKELEAAKSYMIGSMPIGLSSISNIAGILRSLQLDDRPIDYLDRREAILRAVDADDVQAAAKRMLTPDNLTVVIVGKPENVKPDRTVDVIPNAE